MPPRKPKSGAAGRAKRKQITQAAELNLDTAGASDALAAALHLLATVAIRMRKNRRGVLRIEIVVGGYTIRRRMVKNTVTLHFSHTVCAKVVGYSSVHTLAAAEISREQAARTIRDLTREQAMQQAQAEGLTLRKADNEAGYAHVTVVSGRPERFQAPVKCSGNNVHLGSFATAEGAALCVARSPEGQAAARRVAAATAPRTSEAARQQAQAEKLTLSGGREHDGLLRSEARHTLSTQALPGASAARR